MGEENNNSREEDLDDEDLDDDDSSKDEEIVKMSQEAFTKVMERERTKGKRIARREVFRELGVNDLDGLKAKLGAGDTDSGTKDDSSNEESEKARRDAEKATRERDEARAETARLRLDAKKERALLAADVPAKQVARVARMLEVDPNADDDEIEDAVGDLQKEMPHLFAPVDDDTSEDDKSNGSRQDGPPNSDPGRPPRKKNQPSSSKDQAKSLLHERHPQLADKG